MKIAKEAIGAFAGKDIQEGSSRRITPVNFPNSHIIIGGDPSARR